MDCARVQPTHRRHCLAVGGAGRADCVESPFVQVTVALTDAGGPGSVGCGFMSFCWSVVAGVVVMLLCVPLPVPPLAVLAAVTVLTWIALSIVEARSA